MYKQLRLNQMRHTYSVQGWALLIYYGIMNVAVMLVMFVNAFAQVFSSLGEGMDMDMERMMNQLLEDSGWGYFLAIAAGLLALLLWKKPKFFSETVCAKGRPMTAGSFFVILSLFMSGQLIFQLLTMLLELVFNRFGFSLMESMESVSVSTDTLSMFLYVGLGAPITEEILFRGLVMRSMEPYGKRFAIFGSALLFGLFHGNLIQAPYAFGVGVVLGYVAAEYNIVWAMVLHMFNNLILSDTLTRLASELPAPWDELALWIVIIAFSVIALAAVIVKRKEIVRYFRRNRNDPLCARAFFSAPGIITLIAVMGVTIVFSMLI